LNRVDKEEELTMASRECSSADAKRGGGLSRRDLLRVGAVAATAAWVGGCAGPGRRAGPAIRPGGIRPQRIRVGVIGCGGRGTGAALDCVRSSPNIEIVALGDLIAERVNESRQKLTESDQHDCITLTDDACFAGFDAYQKVLACDVDLVILAAPPGFRPQHLEAAVAAGKHVFMEKPVAVDPVGVRKVLAASDQAAQRRLAIVAGTQRRHQPSYLETMERIHDGAIGDLVAAQCYWNQGGLWVKERQPEWSDMEWQCRNWLYFTWLSGDHIVEQHVHNLDVINWAFQSPPVKCLGVGGRQVRTESKYGNIYDHFCIEYEYPGGARVTSMCRQVPGCTDRTSERLVGTRGAADPGGSIQPRRGRAWKFAAREDTEQNPYVLEHADLIDSIRSGRPLNEGRRIAESTLTAIMGRMSAYTGRELQWDWALNASQLDLLPKVLAMGDLPVEPVALPGVTKLV
jgi:predicted dehydrogenase